MHNIVGSLFYDRNKVPAMASAKTEQLHLMSQQVALNGRGLPWYERHRLRCLDHLRFIKERMQKIGWTLLFSFLFLYFVYELCFIHESQRISNEYAKIGAFLMGLFLLLSTLPNTKFYMQIQAQKLERENYEKHAGLRKAEMRDKY